MHVSWSQDDWSGRRGRKKNMIALLRLLGYTSGGLISGPARRPAPSSSDHSFNLAMRIALPCRVARALPTPSLFQPSLAPGKSHLASVRSGDIGHVLLSFCLFALFWPRSMPRESLYVSAEQTDQS